MAPLPIVIVAAYAAHRRHVRVRIRVDARTVRLSRRGMHFVSLSALCVRRPPRAYRMNAKRGRFSRIDAEGGRERREGEAHRIQAVSGTTRKPEQSLSEFSVTPWHVVSLKWRGNPVAGSGGGVRTASGHERAKGRRRSGAAMQSRAPVPPPIFRVLVSPCTRLPCTPMATGCATSPTAWRKEFSGNARPSIGTSGQGGCSRSCPMIPRRRASALDPDPPLL